MKRIKSVYKLSATLVKRYNLLPWPESGMILLLALTSSDISDDIPVTKPDILLFWSPEHLCTEVWLLCWRENTGRCLASPQVRHQKSKWVSWISSPRMSRWPELLKWPQASKKTIRLCSSQFPGLYMKHKTTGCCFKTLISSVVDFLLKSQTVDILGHLVSISIICQLYSTATRISKQPLWK